MATTKAIVVLKPGKAAGVDEVPVPTLRDEWVLVKTKAIALNPTDWKHIDFGGADPGCRVGCDYAGVVLEVGSKVTKFKAGDRIAGLVHGCDRTNHENGAYAERITAKAAIAMHIPEGITFEEAATLGTATATIGQGLYKSLGLPLPNVRASEPTFLLIYAASTVTGMYGIQFAKASGLTVIATASPHNFDYLKTLGADVAFDYRSPTCASDIKVYTKNKLRFAWDCVGTGTQICAAALSDVEPGVMYGTINPADMDVLRKTNPNAAGPLFTLAYDVFGETYVFRGEEIPPKPDEFEFAAKFFDLTQVLLGKGLIKPVRSKVNVDGEGLEGALKGIDIVRTGNVSGTKLVYTL